MYCTLQCIKGGSWSFRIKASKEGSTHQCIFIRPAVSAAVIHLHRLLCLHLLIPLPSSMLNLNKPKLTLKRRAQTHTHLTKYCYWKSHFYLLLFWYWNSSCTTLSQCTYTPIWQNSTTVWLNFLQNTCKYAYLTWKNECTWVPVCTLLINWTQTDNPYCLFEQPLCHVTIGCGTVVDTET